MRVLLINPPIREWAKPNCFPSGLGYVASSLINAGHQVEVIDINAYRWKKDEVEKKIEGASFDLVGIGGMVTIYRYIKWLASVLKKYHPDKKIIVGGSSATSIPRILLERTEVDIACIGEGEITSVKIANAIENSQSLRDIQGIWYKDGEGNIFANPPRAAIKNLDSLPFPQRDLFPMDIYIKNPVGAPNIRKWVDGENVSKDLSINITSSRGCPYKCIFCYHDFMGEKFRTRSAQNIFNEIVYLKEKYNINYFALGDDMFTANKKVATQLCHLLIKSRLNIQFCVSGRVNLMDEDFILKLKEAGCNLIGYGIESGSQKMLDIMKKGVKVEQAKKAIRLTQKYLGWADCTFVIGFPGENRETIQETIDFCKELNLTPEAIFFATPYPGTELYNFALKKGLIVNEEEYLLGLGEQGEKVRVNFTQFSNEELESIKEQMVEELNAWNKMKHE